MRKKIVSKNQPVHRPASSQSWLDLAQIATVEVTSEDPKFLIDSVFNSESGPGWRASEKGEQQVRLIFDHPVSLRHIQLHFLDPDHERTQEFTVQWSSEHGQPQEIVRQQWNFSPSGSTREVEDYDVHLDQVSVLELLIKPDLTHHQAPASLAAWRLA